MKKKVGILTFHRPVNCGAFLQCFATQTFLEKNNIKNVVIDYYSPKQKKIYLSRHVPVKFSPQGIMLLGVVFIAGIFKHKDISRYYSDYHKFIEQNLKMTSKQYTSQDDFLPDSYDYQTIIIGSDQLWNTDRAGFNPFYMLSEVKGVKKISYATSMNGSIKKWSPEEKTIFSTNLRDFSRLAVREQTDQVALSKLLNRKIALTLDPTLLLEASDYSRIIQPSGEKGRFIFLYAIGYNSTVRKIANRISQKYQLTVITWNPQLLAYDKLFIKNCHQIKHQTPGTFLDLIKNAEIVLASSFHGAVFSTIFQKKFAVLKSNSDLRIQTLEHLGLKNFWLYDESKIDNFNFDHNFTVFNKNLAAKRKESAQYFINSVKD